MNRLLKILFLILIGFSAKSQSPVNFPNINTPTGYYNIGWVKGDSGLINAVRDTTVRSRFAGLQFLWQHNGVDTNLWINDGIQYFHYVKSGQDVINALGYVPAPTFTLTTNLTSGPATYTGNILNIPQYSGGGGGGISTLNGLTAATQFFGVGTSGSDFNIVSSVATHTFNLPTASAVSRGLLSTTDWSTFNAKQPQLNGTGFVKATGTTISYDNTVYYPNSNPSNFISRAGISASAPALYNNSTGIISVDTSTGLTHLATQAYVLANQAAGTITGAGNLVPLFTTSVSANTILFTLSNAAANTALTNSTSGSAPPAYGKINNATLSNSTITFSSTDLSGSGSIALGTTLTSNINANAVTYAKFQQVAIHSLVGNPTGSLANAQGITLGYGLKFVGTTLAFDSAGVKDTVFAVNGLAAYGATGDSIGLGGRLYQNTIISGANAYALTLDSFPAASGRGFRVNFGSDAGWDMIVRDSATGYWTRIPKGTVGQALTMLSTGGIGWGAGGGGGGSSYDTTGQNYTSGTTLTQGTSVKYIYVNPSSTQATLTITTLGIAGTWSVSNDLYIVPGGTLTSGTVITTFAVAAGAGLTIIDDIPPTTIQVGHTLHYHKYGALLYRMKD